MPFLQTSAKEDCMSKESNNGDREKFASRLGFILVSAGCAIGLGNVWKFPYICGQNGGAIFIVIYLLCLLLLGYPILTCEFAIGRGSGKSVGSALRELAPKGGNCINSAGMPMPGTICDDVLYYGSGLDGILCVRHGIQDSFTVGQ